MRQSAAALALLIVVACAPVAAQTTGGAASIEALEKCRAETDAPARLACYDRAIDALVVARRSGAITVVTAEEAEKQRRASFGSSKPRLPDITTLDSTVAAVTPSGRDTYRVTLADGTVWRTTEIMRIDPRVGNTVHVRRGALGSYLASFAGARSVRIERIR